MFLKRGRNEEKENLISEEGEMNATKENGKKPRWESKQHPRCALRVQLYPGIVHQTALIAILSNVL